ncbi:MAG: MBL fold metallo-hydrolase [Acidimicrobiia bacterium]
MTWTEHGEGVFSRRYKSLDLNIGAVICDGGTLIIDTRAHHEQARDLIRDLREITDLEVKWVVNTHHHWDHTFGNGEFFEAAIWGHERCTTALADHGHEMREKVKRLAPEHADQLDEVLILPPQHTVNDSTTETFGGRAIELRHLGRGHTDNDLVVLISGVVFAGDLVEEGAPPSYGDAFTLEWPDTVARLLDLVDGPVVPGHGATVDADFVGAQRDDLAEVARLARERHADGMTWEQAATAGGPFPADSLNQAFRRAWAQIGTAS